jgi:hypothetical protein
VFDVFGFLGGKLPLLLKKFVTLAENYNSLVGFRFFAKSHEHVFFISAAYTLAPIFDGLGFQWPSEAV